MGFCLISGQPLFISGTYQTICGDCLTSDCPTRQGLEPRRYNGKRRAAPGQTKSEFHSPSTGSGSPSLTCKLSTPPSEGILCQMNKILLTNLANFLPSPAPPTTLPCRLPVLCFLKGHAKSKTKTPTPYYHFYN